MDGSIHGKRYQKNKQKTKNKEKNKFRDSNFPDVKTKLTKNLKKKNKLQENKNKTVQNIKTHLKKFSNKVEGLETITDMVSLKGNRMLSKSDGEPLIKKAKKKNERTDMNNATETNKTKKVKLKNKIQPISDGLKLIGENIKNATNGKVKKKKSKKDTESLVETDTLNLQSRNGNRTAINIDPVVLKKRKKQLEKLKKLVVNKQERESKKNAPALSLREKMLQKLKAARFRFLNEQIYTVSSKEAQNIFKSDPDAFKAYHEGYRLQVSRWPLNPLDNIIKAISKMPKSHIIADFGCGDAKLAKSVEQAVYSFDLVASNDYVTACDMAHVPLEDSSVDVAVFCLSLMGTNLRDYLLEANRVLKNGGQLKIAEVQSRFEDVNSFIKDCAKFGFKKASVDVSYDLFYFIDFKKEFSAKGKKKLPTVSLQPCLYKKR